MIKDFVSKCAAGLRKVFNSILEKPEYFFATNAIIFGLLFLIIIPPFQTPDELVHFYGAYEVSDLNNNSFQKNNSIGSMLPSSIAITQQIVKADPNDPARIQFNANSKYRLSYSKQALDVPLNENKKQFYSTGYHPVIVYIPQAAAITIGRIFDAPIIVMIYMTRLANLLLWVIVAFLCIRYFPWKRWAIAGVCLLPVVVSQTISPGLDVLAIGSTLGFLTLIFNGLNDRKYSFNTKKTLLLIACVVLMAFTKVTLLIFVPLILLIKKEQITFKYANIIKSLILALPIVLYILWVTSLPKLVSTHEAISSSQQISTFIHDPLHFVHLLLNTGFFVTDSGNLLAQSIVGCFGWLDAPLSPFVAYFGVIYISFLLAVGVAKEKKTISRPHKLLMLLATVASVVVTFLAMYIYWNQPGDNHIKGVQGRYLVPAIIMLIPILLNNQLVAPKKIFVNTVRIGSVVLLGVSVLSIAARYYYTFMPT